MSSTALNLVAILVVAGLAVWLVGVFNSVVQLRNNIGKAWSNIDVVLQQRHDELTKLVDAVRGYMHHEKGVLEEITRLRADYRASENPVEKVAIENELNRQLAGLNVTLENYPDLKSNESVAHLQQRISGLEEQIADRRELFNDSVNVYNITLERFPALLLARLLGYGRRDLLLVPESKKADVEIEFS